MPAAGARGRYTEECRLLDGRWLAILRLFSASHVDLEIGPRSFDAVETGERKIELVLPIVDVAWIGCGNFAGKSQRVICTQDVVHVP